MRFFLKRINNNIHLSLSFYHKFNTTTSTFPFLFSMGSCSSTDTTTTLDFACLRRQDDVTSRAVLNLLKGNAKFDDLSRSEGEQLITRDKEDEDKLAKGILISIDKKVLEPMAEPPSTEKINVLGKSADQVADEIFSKLPAPEEGAASVLILQGLSGTGKGTTVSKLKAKLPKVITWSNGNVFRSVTYLANQALAEKGTEFSSEALTADLLKSCFDRLSFQQFDDQFDVVIDNTQRVGAIANTTLKDPLVSTRVPTVAEQTQGEVVRFAASAIETLKVAGHNVILEGRAQTLNFIPTPYRYELVIPEVAILGSRRAAQRVMAFALDNLKDKNPEAITNDEVKETCLSAVQTLKCVSKL